MSQSESPTLRIGLTPGEPAGIGPELAVRLAQHPQDFELVAICDPQLLQQAADALKLKINIQPIDWSNPPKPSPAQTISVSPIKLQGTNQAGQLNIQNAGYVLETLTTATGLCLSKKISAIVTGPIQKSIINDAGIPFTGHTEFFAEKSHTPKVVMMLATKGLRVALATTHIPLKDVSEAVTKEELTKIIHILNKDLQTKFGIRTPKILVCGLNPHAGEGGHLGHEEIDTIIPALNALRTEGIDVKGPLPADTLFTPRNLGNADAVLAMYHDQGLPVLKHKGFGKAVNITLGLPFVRTSVDHGTALDLAGTGTADVSSLEHAVESAYTMALRRC